MHLEFWISVWDDLAEKNVHLHVAVQLVPEGLLFLRVIHAFETINCRLEMALHVGVISRTLSLRRLEEDLRKRLHFAPVGDLHLVKFAFQPLQF